MKILFINGGQITVMEKRRTKDQVHSLGFNIVGLAKQVPIRKLYDNDPILTSKLKVYCIIKLEFAYVII